MNAFQSIIHLNKRAGFGDPSEHVHHLAAQGYAAAVNGLFKSPSQPLTVEWLETEDMKDQKVRGQNFVRLGSAWAERMKTSEQPFIEKMTLFWHNHFATAEYKVNNPKFMLLQNNLFRRNALGSFRQMLLDVTKDPAMLIWLDNASSTKRAPNENYGRELLELFTIGLTYTQTDVTAASEALTGYALNRKTGQVQFAPQRHDDQLKTFFGDTGNLGPAQIIDDLLSNPHCAPFVVTKILKWFVHPNPPAHWVSQFADVFRSSGYHIGTLMKAIFQSPEFQSDEARNALIKTPADYVIGLARMSAAPLQPKVLYYAMAQCGMELFNPPNVAGWPGGRNWVNSSTLLARFNFAFQVSRHMTYDSALSAVPDVSQLLADYEVLDVSSTTQSQLTQYAATHQGSPKLRNQELLHLLWMSPEFQLC